MTDWDEEPAELAHLDPFASCAHPNTRKTLRTIAGGSRAIYQQCLACGSSVGNAISKLTLADGEYGSLPPFDTSFKERGERDRAKRIEDHRIQQLIDTGSDQIIYTEKYYDYLKSPEWKAKRELVLKRENYVCEGCRSARATVVHHHTYKHIFNELLFELASLCEPCHKLCHPEKQ